MPNTDTKVSQLVINELTKAQFDRAVEAGQISDTELYLVEDEDGSKASFPLLSTMWSDHLLNDISWLRADTFSWQSGDVYTAVYNHLVSDYSESVPVETDVINGITIYYKKSADGHKVCHENQEQVALDIYNSTGVAWYYILDTTNKRFKLPRAKHTSTNVDVFGNGMTLGFTNGTQNFGVGSFYGTTGCTRQSLYGVSVGASSDAGVDVATQKGYGITTDPTKSGIVGKVQRENDSQYMYLYFFVGNYVQNQTAIDIGQMSEQLNDKADRDLGNCTRPYVVEQYDDGAGNGYRVWSNKFCEQWGKITPNTTITFLKEYANTLYIITNAMIDSTSTNNTQWIQFTLRNRTTTGFSLGANGVNQFWKAEGYIL